MHVVDNNLSNSNHVGVQGHQESSSAYYETLSGNTNENNSATLKVKW